MTERCYRALWSYMAPAYEGAPPRGNPAVYPAGTPRAGERKFKITLAGMNAKVKDNENPIQKKLAI